ncbi:Zinc finger CCCH domain-containing protein 3 [Linum perenne]
MPLGKYHCDYCDKDFQDTLVARKRHLQSSSHLRAKSLWYNSFPSSSSDAPPLNPKQGLCNRFLKTGFCPFGDSCKYLHLNSNAAAPQNYNSSTAVQVPGLVAAGSSSGNPVPSWNFQPGRSSLPAVPNSMGGWWGNLPPSLMPPPEGGYPSHLPYLDWG